MERRNFGSGTPWEQRVGYSRCVRVGSHVFVAGTIAADVGGVIAAVGDPYRQTQFILRKIETALAEAGATMADVVRTRTYVTNFDHWERIGDAHREVFDRIRPCATMVEVSRLAAPEALVEIEVDAVVGL